MIFFVIVIKGNGKWFVKIIIFEVLVMLEIKNGRWLLLVYNILGLIMMVVLRRY